MNPKRLAQALNTISMGFAEAAEALNDSSPAAGTPGGAGRESGAAVPSGTPAPSSDPWYTSEPPYQGAFPSEPAQPTLADESVDFAPQGSEAQCPKHRQPYKDGRYGPFCSALTDDPDWAKVKPDGKMFCSITPKSAVTWLRQQAAVGA